MSHITDLKNSILLGTYKDECGDCAEDRIEIGQLANSKSEPIIGTLAVRMIEYGKRTHVNLTPAEARRMAEDLMCFADIVEGEK